MHRIGAVRRHKALKRGGIWARPVLYDLVWWMQKNTKNLVFGKDSHKSAASLWGILVLKSALRFSYCDSRSCCQGTAADKTQFLICHMIYTYLAWTPYTAPEDAYLWKVLLQWICFVGIFHSKKAVMHSWRWQTFIINAHRCWCHQAWTVIHISTFEIDIEGIFITVWNSGICTSQIIQGERIRRWGIRVITGVQDSCVHMSVTVQQDCRWGLQVLLLDVSKLVLVLDNQVNLESKR